MLRQALVLFLVLLPLPALAQSAPASDDSHLQQSIRQKKIIVQPKIAPEVITREANEAVDEMTAEQRRDATLREMNRPMPRRPDLNEDVTGGIQTRGLKDVRPR
jgi:hypothetical protein